MTALQNRLSLRQVEIVDAVARHRSMSRAAEELRLTQSALSHAVNSIENQLGVTLFARQKTGVEPTPFADPFRARASAIRAVLADTRRELESQAKKSVPTVRIQCGFRTGAQWITRALAALTESNPDFQADVNFNLQSFQSNLESGPIDIGLTDPNHLIGAHDFVTEYLGQIRNNFFAAPHHPLAHVSAVTMDDLRQYPMVGNLIIPPQSDIFESNPGRLGTYDPVTRTMQCAITINTIGGVIDVLRRSDGIARLPQCLVEEEVAAGYIVQLNDALIPMIPIDIHIMARHSTLERQEIRLFIDALKKANEELIRPEKERANLPMSLHSNSSHSKI